MKRTQAFFVNVIKPIGRTVLASIVVCSSGPKLAPRTKRIFLFAPIAAMALFTAGQFTSPARASLIDDDINISLYDSYSYFSLSNANPVQVTDPGVESKVLIKALNGSTAFEIDVSATAITFRNAFPGNFFVFFGDVPNTNITLTFSDLDWVGQPRQIVGLSFSTVGTTSRVGADDFLFTNDTVQLLLGNTFFDTGASVTVELEVERVPEPVSLSLLAIGSAALLRRSRRVA